MGNIFSRKISFPSSVTRSALRACPPLPPHPGRDVPCTTPHRPASWPFYPCHTRSATPHQASSPRPPTRHPDPYLSEHDSEITSAALSTERFFIRSEMRCSTLVVSRRHPRRRAFGSCHVAKGAWSLSPYLYHLPGPASAAAEDISALRCVRSISPLRKRPSFCPKTSGTPTPTMGALSARRAAQGLCSSTHQGRDSGVAVASRGLYSEHL